MSGPKRASGRGALTPAVLAASAFTAIAALASVAFVTARGGLELPVAATSAPAVAIASSVPTIAPSSAVMPTVGPPTPGPSATTEPPPATPSAPVPTISQPPTGSPDPLAALTPCPVHPGCFVYTVRRGDTYSGVSDRYAVGLWIMDALNPEVGDKRIIVVGETLYLGHDPTARLDMCPDRSCHLYAVRSGDTLSTIAGRYGLSVAGIEARNPGLDPAIIVTGQVIKLPLYQPS